MLPTRIYLIGFMGSGKSTIGPILANVLGYGFTDLDKRIEADADCAIHQIFEKHGEPFFRNLEREALRATASLDGHVIAIGGGAFVDKANRRIIKDAGLSVYLRMSVDDLVVRLRRSRSRPLLSDEQGNLLPPPSLSKRIERLLAERESTYLQADLVVDIENGPVGRTVDLVVSHLRHLSKSSP